MQVTREVILDLLPIYLADEASEETCALVRQYLDTDPDLARLASQWKERLPGPPPMPLRTDAQAEAFLAAKRQITLRTVGLAAILTGGILGLTSLIGLFFFLPSLSNLN